MINNKQFNQLIKKSEEIEGISADKFLKIYDYFNSLKNVDMTNVINNMQRGTKVYSTPLKSIVPESGRLVNIPSKNVVFVDEKFMKENPDVALLQVTHELMHAVSLYRNGKVVTFGHSSSGGSDTNKYNGVLEACTQMFAEEAEGKRLPENVDYLYYLKNIMRIMKVLFGEEIQILENYKLNLNKSVAELIRLKTMDNPKIFDVITNEIQDERFSKQLNPNLILSSVKNENAQKQDSQQDEILIDFAKKFCSSYRYLESDSDYGERVNSEESDIEYVAEYINKYNASELDDIRSKIVNKETGKMKARRIFQLLNAAKILSIGNQNYFETLCKSPEVKDILEQMLKTPFVQQIIEKGEQTKKSNPNSKNPLTDGEKMNINAKKALEIRRKISQDKDNLIFDSIVEIVQKGGSATLGGFRKEDLDLAKICCLQRGIKTVQKDFGGIYGLNVVEESINPQKVKQDTIMAGINFSEINRYIREVKNTVINAVKGENENINR